MDFQKWVAQVREISERLTELAGEIDCKLIVDPPLLVAEIDQLEHQNWPTGLPDALRDLWRDGSARVNLQYYWTPNEPDLRLLKKIDNSYYGLYGGPQFLTPDEIYPGNSGADPNDEAMLDTLGERCLGLFCKCAIFQYIANGDCLALDVEQNSIDPPVVYLVHDDPSSCYISQSFTQFLTDWAEIMFVGPEIWVLEPWLDREQGKLDVHNRAAKAMRKLILGQA